MLPRPQRKVPIRRSIEHQDIRRFELRRISIREIKAQHQGVPGPNSDIPNLTVLGRKSKDGARGTGIAEQFFNSTRGVLGCQYCTLFEQCVPAVHQESSQ